MYSCNIVLFQFFLIFVFCKGSDAVTNLLAMNPLSVQITISIYNLFIQQTRFYREMVGYAQYEIGNLY